MRRILETLVVDISAMLAFISRGEHSIRMQFWLETASLTYATDQLTIDLADYFCKLVLQDKISTHSALAVCDNARKLIDHYVSTTSLWQESLVESIKYRITAQEMAPIILARKINAGYLTLVEKKRRIAEELGIQVY